MKTDDTKENHRKGGIIARWAPPYKIVPLHQGDGDGKYSELPGYQACPFLEHYLKNEKPVDFPSPLGKFLKKLRRDGCFVAWCLLVTFDIVLQHGKKDVDDNTKDSWTCLLKNDNFTLECHETNEDVLLVEGWPLIQDLISWKACQSLFRRIQTQTHILTLPHPLTCYAQQTLLELSNKDFSRAIEISESLRIIPPNRKIMNNRLEASQLFLDYVASLPSREMAVLLEDPLLPSTSPSLSQSCLPSSCLELSIDDSIGTKKLSCSLIALYDLQPNEEYTISTRPPVKHCSCQFCRYEKNNDCSLLLQSDTTNSNFILLQRFAHSCFHKGNYSQAKRLYQVCYDKLLPKKQQLQENSYYRTDHGDEMLSRNNNSTAADIWHSIAAVELTQQNFLQAQKHWREGTKYRFHPGIALQIEKHVAYRYFDPLPSTISTTPNNRYQVWGTSSRPDLFVAPNTVSPEICGRLIAFAEDHTAKSGWTTSRHYAVPTNDIPVHQVPKLLDWFVPWIEHQVHPLLQEQFQTNQRFYVHDAFLVRYQSSSANHFLPLHYDESTHSMILALNEDFEGGGTYFYNLDHQTVTPKTGSLVTFRGDKLLHGGNVVTKGVRYILAVFLYLDIDSCSSGGGAPNMNELEEKDARTLTLSESLTQEAKRLKKGADSGFVFSFF